MAGVQQSTENGSRFKSEMFVPIRQDKSSFEERQNNIWDEMHERMERRRKAWDEEVRIHTSIVSTAYVFFLNEQRQLSF